METWKRTLDKPLKLAIVYIWLQYVRTMWYMLQVGTENSCLQFPEIQVLYAKDIEFISD